jgi:hypothetical protein
MISTVAGADVISMDFVAFTAAPPPPSPVVLLVEEEHEVEPPEHVASDEQVCNEPHEPLEHSRYVVLDTQKNCAFVVMVTAPLDVSCIQLVVLVGVHVPEVVVFGPSVSKSKRHL